DVDVLEGLTEQVTEMKVPASVVDDRKTMQVLKNVNNDTVRLVNELLKNGKHVGLVQEDKFGFKVGDFVVRTEDILPFNDNYVFEADVLTDYQAIGMKWIAEPKVASNGSGQLIFSLKELGFNLSDEEQADIIVSDSNLPKELNGKSFVGIGNNVLKAVH